MLEVNMPLHKEFVGQVGTGTNLRSVPCWRSVAFRAALPFPPPSDTNPNCFPEVCQSSPRLCACKRPFVHLFCWIHPQRVMQ